MDFLELVKKRRSVRSYLDKPVEESLLEKVLEAGRLAPSACNNQPWAFIVIRDKASRKRLENVYKREWFLNAPIIIAVCGDHSASWKSADGRDSVAIDGAIALDHMTLAATELGLGTCWVGAFDTEEARKALMLPENVEPIAFCPLGYPGPEKTLPKNRKRLQEIVFRERYGNR